MKNVIIFTDIDNPDGVLEKPRPASKYIPEWYKKAKNWLNDQDKKELTIDGSPAGTVKRCMPLLDMMTAGYILETPYDIYVRQTENGPYFQWGEMQAISFQPIEQVQDHPWFKNQPVAVRLVHPWSIKTPKGWSIIIMNPTHRDESPIQVLPGIVDTDSFCLKTNIFIKLTDPNFEGLIPKGTPFAQIIPIKRENWSSKLGGDKEKKYYNIDSRKFTTIFFDRYKKMWWSKKTYR